MMKVSEVVWENYYGEQWVNKLVPDNKGLHRLWIPFVEDNGLYKYATWGPIDWIFSPTKYKTPEEAQEACVERAVELGILEDDRVKEIPKIKWINNHYSDSKVVMNVGRLVTSPKFKNKWYYTVIKTGLVKGGFTNTKESFDGSKGIGEDKPLIAVDTEEEAKRLAVLKAIELGLLGPNIVKIKLPDVELEDEMIDTRTPEERINDAVKMYHIRRNAS
jgi:hypothetical protein